MGEHEQEPRCADCQMPYPYQRHGWADACIYALGRQLNEALERIRVLEQAPPPTREPSS